MTALDALNLAAPLADTYEAVEQRLLVAIARQLSLNDNHTLNEVSKWQIKQLARHGMLSKNAAQIIAAGTKGIPGDVAGAVEQAINAALAEDGLTEMWRNEGFAESAKQAVKHYRAQAKDVYNQVNTVMKYKAESTFVNAVNSIADKWQVLRNKELAQQGSGNFLRKTAEMRREQAELADKQDFLDILNSHTAAVVSGSTARTRAVRDTIHEMAQKGIPAFVDRAGREWSPEAYVNMDIRATVKNTALEAKFSVMDSLGQDVFEVSSHPGSRPKCRPWQGKLISRSGRTTEITDLHGRKHKVIPLSQTSYGEPDGLFGINCGHRPRGCTEGVFTKSEVEYDDEEDKELYNKVCQQRELERRVRKSKTEADMLKAAGDSEGAKAVRRKMAEQNKQLKAYCEDNGLKYRSDRVRTYGRVDPKSALDKSAESGIIDTGRSGNVALEYQRYGRNKNTLVNKTYIDSGEYRRKFDKLTDNPEVNKAVYDCAKSALKHRSGTELEDMYWFDGATGKIIAKELNSTNPRQVVYSAATKSAVGSAEIKSIIALHTHPSSMPPSIEDFNACFRHGYKCGFIACHNGKVYGYSSEQLISAKLYELCVGDFLDNGLPEFEAQTKALEELKRNHKIDFWEVK